MYSDWSPLPKQEEILNVDSIEKLKEFHNIINKNAEVLSKIIKNSMYNPNGEPNYEIGVELEKKKEELLNRNIDVITAHELYIKTKIKPNEISNIPTLIWYANRLREIPIEISKAENHSLIKIIKYHLIELKKIDEETKITNSENRQLIEDTLELNELSLKAHEGNKEELKKIENNFLAILGIFISIFSIITINFSLFEKLSNLSVYNLLLFAGVINISIFIVIYGLFEILKKYKDDSTKWFLVKIIPILLILLTMILFGIHKLNKSENQAPSCYSYKS